MAARNAVPPPHRPASRRHSAANAQGYIKRPNVEMMVEMADMREASRSYEANLQMIRQAREMTSMMVDLLKGS